ncbi:Hypothetical protein FKW44_009079 [Caligus rogercresseyi]|uniref:Uncharacterized protein n=1 Tax=Caligus rogercresseyi TaxID=217165 RepID=A0A7T8HF86_CALRO|nr:Hypothetical protein FKW44_009079 [Caligus rogercresseyi]
MCPYTKNEQSPLPFSRRTSYHFSSTHIDGRRRRNPIETMAVEVPLVPLDPQLRQFKNTKQWIQYI